MKVNVIVEVRDHGTAGVSVSGADVGPNYCEELLAERARRCFRAAKANLRQRIAAKEAERAKQALLFA